MALLRYGPLADLVLGSLGGTTFTQTGQGPAIKTRSTRPFPASAAKLAAQSATVEVAKTWQTLTDLERASWTALGLTLVRATPIGTKYHPTGYATFMALNVPLQASGHAINTTAPAIAAPARVNRLALLPVYSSGNVAGWFAYWNGGIAAATAVVLEMTPAFPWGFEPDAKRLQKIHVYPAVTTPKKLITTAWTDIYGNPPLTAPYRILARMYALNTTTGATGCPLDWELADDTGTPMTPAPSSITPTTSSPAAENWHYITPGDTVNPAYVWLNLTPGLPYTITFTNNHSTGSPQILSGPNVGSLTTLTTLGIQDQFSFVPAAATLYFLSLTATTSGTTWTVLIQIATNKPPPTITGISPNTGPAAGGTAVTITGAGFAARDLVYFGDTPTLVSDTTDPNTATATSPPGTAGTVDITIHGNYGCSAASSADQFTYT